MDTGEDAVWASGPLEGFEIDVGLCAALEAAVGELGEESFDSVEPRGRSWREMEGPTGVLREPFAHLRVLVGGIVVDDCVDRLSPGTWESISLRKWMNS